MIDPIKSLLVDAEQFWSDLEIGGEVTSRDIYRTILTDNNYDSHKLNALGAFLSKKVKYGMAKTIGAKVSDPRYKKVSIQAIRAKNKRFCDVINESLTLNEQIPQFELSLRYKDKYPKHPITKSYITKLIHALITHKCVEKLDRGIFRKLRDIQEHEMTTVTRFIEKKKAPTPVIKILPNRLSQLDGYAAVKSKSLDQYLNEIKTLKLIIEAQRKELDATFDFIKTLPRVDLPLLETGDYEDLKKKYGIP